jgi:enoyl-CoA hydratase/carnithine racemase
MGLVDWVAAPTESLSESLLAFCKPMLQKPRHILAAFKTLINAQRRIARREELYGLETSLFAQAWVDEAHWLAAETALARSRA